MKKNTLLRTAILIFIFLSSQISFGNNDEYTKLNAQINAFNDSHNYEKSIIYLEKIITNPKSSHYDLYNAYFQKYQTYKRLFNYTEALNNLDLALKAGLLSNKKEEVEIQIKIEKLFIHFDLLEFDKVTQILPTISEEQLKHINPQTKAFYLSILGTMELRKKNFRQGEIYLDEALVILLKSAPKHLPLIYKKKIGLYKHLKQYKKALESFEKGLYYAKKYKMDIYVIAMYNDISHFYNEIGDTKNAALAQQKILSLSTKYDATNRNGKLHLLEKKFLQKSKDLDNENQNYTRTVLTISIISLVIILLVLFYLLKSAKHKRTVAELKINNISNELENVTKELSESGQSKINLANYNLTERQNQIIALVKQGKTNKEIGVELFISENTVKYHLKIIYEALNITNRSKL
ncbi:helix-turn-helix transcriptional regulator [Flavobacterium sp. EDS]|uniref:helix-turn-helix domain-containing protein n=1 Tax=Flavobacterium sp. EDS TaxID=2897328 RepID=UPI001E59B257|nr:helix-turn-helix transcriptional regulator [Flavobacterium sp. EDS]MCD0476233.1 helix-turn-helix transcriptional regulator [Flavobacterium sp. EDS]